MKVNGKEDHEPEITIDQSELTSRGGHGLTTASITITRPDGKQQRFHIKMFEKQSGHIACRVTAVRLNLPQDISKEVVGSWYEPNKKLD